MVNKTEARKSQVKLGNEKKKKQAYLQERYERGRDEKNETESRIKKICLNKWRDH